MSRSRTSLRQRRARVRSKLWAVGQCAVAAGVAWTVATQVFGHVTPIFAPVAAVVSLGTSYGQRLRRVAEVSVGVAIGVFVGDAITAWLGSGGWQIALIVALAMMTALLLDQGVLFVNQAAIQAIFVSALVPTAGAAFTRWTDALIGGGGRAGRRCRRTPGTAAAAARAGRRDRPQDLGPAAGGGRERARR